MAEFIPHVDLSRHRDVYDPGKYATRTHIIGCGATGTHVAYNLAKLGVADIHLYDFDKVEPHNLANQMFGDQHIGHQKVEALEDTIRFFFTSEELKITTHDKKVQSAEDMQFSGEGNDTVFVLTDTIDSRAEIIEMLYNAFECDLVIETRMGVREYDVYCFNPIEVDDYERWKKTLPEDGDDMYQEVSACGSSLSVGSTAFGLASEAVWAAMRGRIDDYPDFKRSYRYASGEGFPEMHEHYAG